MIGSMSRRGSILILAIFFLFLVQFLAFAYLRLVPVELTSAGRTRTDVAATLAAEAGLEHTLAWMENELAHGREPTNQQHATRVRTGGVEGWNWTVRVVPDAQTPPNGNSNQRVYTLTAEARQGGDNSRIYSRMRCSVMQESFAAYTRFIDHWQPGTWVAAGPAQVRGRFHTNDVLHMVIYPGFYDSPDPDWPNGPTFWGRVSAARRANTPDGVDYRSLPGDSPPPYAGSNEKVKQARYKALFKGGSQSLRTGVGRIPMPETGNLNNLALAAWGTAPFPPRNQRLFFNPGQGIYVSGDVQSLTLDRPEAGVSEQRFEVSGQTLRVVEVRQSSFHTPGGQTVAAGRTALLGPGAQEQVLDGLPNGVIFVDGDIAAVSGVNRGPHTLAARGNISMAKKGDLLQDEAPKAKEPYVGGKLETSGKHPLGIFCRNFRVPAFPHEGDNLYLYASIVCSAGGNGSLIVDDRDNSAHGAAKLVVVGSLIEDERNYWASTTVRAGYGAVLQHDPHLLTEAPPEFPCTPHLTMKLAVHGVQ